MDGLALFDLDNTLLDREAAFSRWASGFADEYRLPSDSIPLIEQADGDGLAPREAFFETIRQDFGITTPMDTLLERYHCRYPACFEVSPETVDSMRILRAAGWSLGVVTNGPPSQMGKLLATGLVDEVDTICISEEVGAWKPDPAIFREAARRCRRALDGWMVGDSVEADVVGGRNSGLRTVWMSRGRAWTSPEPVPDAIAGTIPEAVAVILGSA
jgi:FMN phosphatase YigB (HAD superfamily)